MTTAMDCNFWAKYNGARDEPETAPELRAIVKGQRVDPALVTETGLTVEQLTDLAGRMKTCRFGVLFFGMVVVFTMLAAMSFDPRLIWDSIEAEARAEAAPAA